MTKATRALSAALWGSISHHSRAFNLPAEMIAAMIVVESAGQIHAWRPEPRYRWLWDVQQDRPFRSLTRAERDQEAAPRDFPYIRGVGYRNAEWWGQQASWGPMQIMGAVARETGFTGWFPALCSTSTGVKQGVKFLKILWRRHWHNHGAAGVLRAYNTGSPGQTEAGLRYQQKVFKHWEDHE